MVWIKIMKIRNPNLVRSFQHAQTICPSWNKCRWWRPCIRTWLKAQTRCCAGCARMSVTVNFPLPTARLCRRDSLGLVSHFHTICSFVTATPYKRAEWKPRTFLGLYCKCLKICRLESEVRFAALYTQDTVNSRNKLGNLNWETDLV
jgi:hypothetical protein